MNNEEFANAMLQFVRPRDEPFAPRSYHNRHGNCIEFIFVDEDYVAERMDELLTLYKGETSGNIVGVVIKGVSTKVAELLDEHPGLKLEVCDGHRFKLEAFFTWGQLSSRDKFHALTYKTLRQMAEESQAEVELLECE